MKNNLEIPNAWAAAYTPFRCRWRLCEYTFAVIRIWNSTNKTRWRVRLWWIARANSRGLLVCCRYLRGLTQKGMRCIYSVVHSGGCQLGYALCRGNRWRCVIVHSVGAVPYQIRMFPPFNASSFNCTSIRVYPLFLRAGTPSKTPLQGRGNPL